MKDDWQAWLERGKKDTDRVTDALEKQDYEHAAYMAQQALEKHVKSVWIVSDMGNPKDLKHDIMGHIVDAMRDGFKTCEFDSSSLSKADMTKTADLVASIMKDMREHYSTKVAFWRHSLGIDVTEVSERFAGHAEEADKFLANFKSGGDELRIVSRKAASKASSYAKSHIAVEQAKIRTVAVLAIFSTVELIIKTFPHSTYGRYPNYIDKDGAESTEIYARRADDLKKLLDETKEACRRLSEVASDLGRAKHKA